MIKIEIKDAAVTEKQGTSMKGRPYKIRSQVGWAFLVRDDGLVEPYPQKIEVSLGDAEPYKPGMYSLSPVSLAVSGYGQLQIRRAVLVPSSVAAARAA